jgi:hypothetical protein
MGSSRRATQLRIAALGLAAALALACGDYGGGSSGGGTSGTPASSPPVAGTPPPSGGGTGTDGVTAFAQTVYPLLTLYCSDCHAGAGPGSPSIAHPDVAVAYDAVVLNQKVNLAQPSSSRLVRRLVADFHHCWSDCLADGMAMQAAIEQWAALLAAGSGGSGGTGGGSGGGTTTTAGTITTPSLAFSDGIEDTGAERYRANLIALYEFKEGSGTVARDTSGVAPAMDLTLSDARWLSNHGIEFLPGKAQASAATSRKLYDRIAEPGAGTQQYSIEAWSVAANVTQEGPARIVAYASGSGSANFTMGQVLYNYVFRNRSLAAGIDGNGRPDLSTRDADQDLQATLQHVVLTYDQYRGRRIHVNGVWTGDVDAQGGGRLWSWDPNFSFVLGNTTTSDRPWLGRLQLVAIYDHALTEAQILQNFGAGVGKRLILRFDIGQWAGAGSLLEFTVSELDDYSYLFCKPTVITPNPSGQRVTGIRIAVNGQAPVAGQSFAVLDAIVSSARQELSPLCAVVAKDGGAAVDTFSIEFDQLGNFLSPAPPAPAPLPPPVPVPSLAPVEGIRSFDRLNETLAAITGISPGSPGVAATFQEIEQQLPPDVDLRAFSSSQQVGIAKLALEYCDALVESPAARDAFFGATPPFPFDSDATTVFGDLALRDRLIRALVDRAYGISLASQPAPADVTPVLNQLFDTLTAGCTPATCDAVRTRTIAKAACAAVLASPGTQVH